MVLDLLLTFRSTPRGLPSAANWVFSSDIRLHAVFASSQLLMLMGFYNMALNKSRLAFKVTTEAEGLRGLAETQPGLLIVTEQMAQGSGLALVKQARDLVHGIRTILIVDGPNEDRVAAGRSPLWRPCVDAGSPGPPGQFRGGRQLAPAGRVSAHGGGSASPDPERGAGGC